MSIQLYICLSFIFLSIWYAHFCEYLKKRHRAPYPPGPVPHFLLGNIPDFPAKKAWLKYNEWKQQYGDIIYLNMMNQSIVILNSREACVDLLEKRSSNYSSRSRLVMLREIRMFHQYMNEHTIQDYRPAQERHAHRFLRNLLESPDQFINHIRLLFATSIMDVVYGIKVENLDDIYVRASEAALHGISLAGSHGGYMVDTFPWLKYIPAWFPGAGFQRQGAKWKANLTKMLMLPYERVKKNIAVGMAGPSILASMLSRCDDEETFSRSRLVSDDSTEEIARNAAGISYVAGSDTTLSSIQSFFLALAKWPEVQRVAQAEIDTVVGNLRLPTFEDRENLPYIQALTKETLRWHNVLPLGCSHTSVEDDEYKGYFIPKGTIVTPNVWTILHDPSVYPDPEVFNPERFLIDTPQGKKIHPDIPDPTPAFGFGRRICPGRHFAENSLFITAANVLAAFDITTPLDASGKPVNLEVETVGRFLTYPAPFKVTITPRSQQAARLVQESEML